MRTLLPRCPDLLPNNVICDIYEKDKKHIFGDDPALPVNQRLIAVNNMYAWLYNRGILEKISPLYKDYDTATYFSFDTRDLRPYMAEMLTTLALCIRKVEVLLTHIRIDMFQSIMECVF